MKKLFKPANIIFYVLMAIAFFIGGIFYAKITGTGEGQMLAAGAIIVGWGVLFSGIAFIASFFIAWYTNPDIIKRLNWGLLVAVIVTIGIVRYLNPREDKVEQEKPGPVTKPTAPAADPVNVEPITLPILETDSETRDTAKYRETIQEAQPQLNIGFFKPNFYENRTLYFYGGVNLQKGLIEHTPVDSVVFKLDQNGNFTTSYAPPWLVPEYMVLDYGIMYFKMQSVGYDFINVISNEKDGREAYLDKNAGEMLFWSEFLLAMNSVEFLPGKEQTIKIKPLDFADEVTIDFEFMKPLLVGSEWMQVVLLDNNLKDLAMGWIRWQKDGKLLISYSLLS